MNKIIYFFVIFFCIISSSRADYLYGYGLNNYGQLGDSTIIPKSVPTLISSDTNWKIVESNNGCSLAIKTDGTLWAWGTNYYGRVGDSSGIDRHFPVQLGTDTNWVYISCGPYHNAAIKKNRTLWLWGDNSQGMLGFGNMTDKEVPTQLGTDTNWVSVSCGLHYTFAIKKDGTLCGWGYNYDCELGNGTNSLIYTPTKIGFDNDWKKVACGVNHTLAQKTDGTLWAWGNNTNGQLGVGASVYKSIPTKINNDINWKSFDCSENLSVAIKTDGTIWAWGYNNFGQLGDGTTVSKNFPNKIGLDTDWVAISCDSYNASFASAIKLNGSIWSWGYNNIGQLGDGTTVDKHRPTLMCNLYDWKSVSCGNDHTLLLRANFSPLTKPTLIFPFDSSKNQSVNITFLWSKVYTATSYRIQVATDSLFANIVTNATASDTSFLRIPNFTENSKYYWRVKAYRMRGPINLDSSSWSDVWNFTTKINANIIFVDMKKSPVGLEKDSAIVAFLKNNSSAPLSISQVKISQGDSADFGVVGLTTPFVIPANSTYDIKFSFTPSSLGIKKSFIRVMASDTILQTVITGEGVKADTYVGQALISLIDFGQVKVKNSKDSTKIAVIKNIGSGALTISSASLKHNSIFSVSASLAPLTLAPNGSAIISLKFSPDALGFFTDSLIIVHNGSNASSVIKLQGEGVEPSAEKQMSLIDFGQVAVNSHKDTNQVAVIKNIGAYPLTINLVKLKSGAVFSITDSLSPMIIAPGAFAKISLKFSPITAGIQRDILIISHDGAITSSQILLQGEGMASGVETVNQIIDFGNVEINAYKDTILVATIKNIGNSTINISSSSIAIGQLFTIIGGQKTFSLEPDSIAHLSIKFTPIALGMVHDTLVYKHNGDGGESRIILQGVGTAHKLAIVNNIIDFGETIVSTPKDTIKVAVFANAGSAPIIISSAKLKNNTVFSISDSISPITIAPGDTARISLKFMPTATVNYSDSLNIYYEGGANSVGILLIGVGIDSKAELLVNRIDFGKVLVNNPKDTSVIVIKNSGKADLAIDSVKIKKGDNFIITSALSHTILPKDASAGISLKFTPNSAIVYGDSLIIYSKKSQLSIELLGEGIAPKSNRIIKVIDFGNVDIMSFNDTITATIKNIGTANLEIKGASIFPNDQEFTISSGAEAYNLVADSVRQISLVFQPTKVGAHSANLIYEYNGLAPDTILLLGFVTANAECLIKVDTTEGEIGIKTEIPIYIINKKNLEYSGISSFDITLSFNETILFPLNATMGAKLNGRQFVTFNAPYISSSKDSVLFKLKVLPVLGDAESSAVKIENITAIGGSTVISQNDGEFKILGLCKDGGTRLVNGALSKSYLAIYPNPASEKVKLGFFANSKECVNIYICNELGVKLVDFQSPKYDETGYKELTVDISSLNSGAYFIAYKTNKDLLVKKLEIVK